jgi:hexosaminidase
MAFYKLNKFMFGLSNDEGWRLEIKGIPELTSVGAVRGHTEDEEDHLLPAYGSGPFPQADDNHGTGHYSREEFIDILQYAAERHIEVIPEINFPGHARAAIKSMEARASRLETEGSSEPTYLLQDPNDQSEYQSVQGYTDNVICPCQESVYQFLEKVVAEIVEMYQEAGVKLTTIHTGGDEVPSGIWEKSPLCTQFLEENPHIEGTKGLPAYFLRRYHEILNQHQLVTAGWEEIAMHKIQQPNSGPDNPTGTRKVMVPNPEFVDSNFLPYVWRATWGVAGEDLAYRLANLGYKVVMCNASNLYFDFAYNKDPLEPGFYWAGLVNTRKPYELVPLDVLQAATVDIMGNPLDMDRYEDHVKLTEASRQNLLGIQAQLWSETVKGPEMLEYYLFPKMLGLSERAWAPDPEWAHLPKKKQRLEGLDQAWNIFANALAQRELVRMDHLWDGVNYRLPLPGAIIEEGQLKANIAMPGLAIRYTLDGSEPGADSPLYGGSVEARKPVRLKAFTSTGKGSRVSVLSY